MKNIVLQSIYAIFVAPFYALVYALVLQPVVEYFFKFRPSYGMAYKASLSAQLVGTIAGIIAIVLFNIAGFDLNIIVLVLSATASLATGTYIYGRMFVHPDIGPIGFKNALKITGTFLVVAVILIGIILVILGGFGYLSKPSTNTVTNYNQDTTNQVTSNQIFPVNPDPYINQNQTTLAPAAQPAPATPVTPLQEPSYPPVTVVPAIPLTPVSAPATAAAPPQVQPWVVAQSPMGGFVGGLSPQNKVVWNSWDYPGAKADYNPATGVYRIDNGLPQGVQAAVVRRR